MVDTFSEWCKGRLDFLVSPQGNLALTKTEWLGFCLFILSLLWHFGTVVLSVRRIILFEFLWDEKDVQTLESAQEYARSLVLLIWFISKLLLFKFSIMPSSNNFVLCFLFLRNSQDRFKWLSWKEQVKGALSDTGIANHLESKHFWAFQSFPSIRILLSREFFALFQKIPDPGVHHRVMFYNAFDCSPFTHAQDGDQLRMLQVPGEIIIELETQVYKLRAFEDNSKLLLV